MAGGHVHQNTAGLHRLGVGLHLLLLMLVNVQHACVTKSTERDKPRCLVRSVAESIAPVHGQHRTELLMGEGFALRDVFHLADEDLGSRRNREPCKFGDGGRTLPDNCRVDRLALGVDDRRAKQIGFSIRKEVCSPGEKFCLHGVIDILVADDCLLTGTHNPVVEGLGHEDGTDCHLDVCTLVHQGGGIARSHPNGRNAG
ncbi:hypothetical protein SDC9_153047 [bioreactor metagenome]|uniref:Uncharacterized protein n=1 Tax=bioreactor metagenome TaxID=1076179 RepID=A0A645EZH6_9ZZZZ